MAWRTLTLVTDASFGGLGVAGWGSWAKADGLGSHIDSGPVDLVEVETSNEAELAAVVHGLRSAMVYAPRHHVLLQSDSMHVLRLLKHHFNFRDSPHKEGLPIRGNVIKEPSPRDLALLGMLRGIVKEQRIEIWLRHVKGHSENAKGRHWVNGKCDQSARRWMQTIRELKHKDGQPLEETGPVA